jgi:hypothetical protein
MLKLCPQQELTHAEAGSGSGFLFVVGLALAFDTDGNQENALGIRAARVDIVKIDRRHGPGHQ